MIAAVIFDLDGVLIDSEPVWEQVRRAFVEGHGGRWLADSQQRMMGMSTGEWAAYLTGDLGVHMPAEEAAGEVLARVAGALERQLPLMEGAVAAVHRLADRWPLGLASSSGRSLIAAVLQHADLARFFAAVVSTEEVAHGKPAPDVYLEAARRLGVDRHRCVAVEDSSNGLRAAAAARMRVVAIPNRHYPPAADALAAADLVLESARQLTVEALEQLGV